MRGGGCLFEGISYTRLYGFCGYIVDSCRPKAAGRHESRRSIRKICACEIDLSILASGEFVCGGRLLCVSVT